MEWKSETPAFSIWKITSREKMSYVNRGPWGIVRYVFGAIVVQGPVHCNDVELEMGDGGDDVERSR